MKPDCKFNETTACPGKPKFSHVTMDYLAAYHCILERMIKDMTEVELTDSISYNFMIQMIPHHQAAIEMSRNILKYTTFIPLQEIAENIICEQTKSIENMRDIMCCCKKKCNSEHDLCFYQKRMDKIMETMFQEMQNARSTNQINANFMREMIPHHAGAVRMSKNALCYDICPELIPILKSIISSQEKGICQMQQFLRCMRCQ